MTNTPAATFRPPTNAREAETGLLLTPRFDAAGLLPAVATDARTGDVLMLAWMDASALARTIETAEAHFFSRSRQRLWRKGEESGNIMRVLELRVDCDQDAIWLKVQVLGDGVACHTGQTSCFYRRLVPGAPLSAGPPLELLEAK
jgi:phosphoribosyl-AMP cyclohydrolase